MGHDDDASHGWHYADVWDLVAELRPAQDALVHGVGVPDPAFGEAVAAVVSLAGDDRVTADELIVHVKGRIAGYKAPRHVLIVDDVERGPNGKADYAGARRRLLDHLSATSTASVQSD